MGRVTELTKQLMQNPDFRAGFERQKRWIEFGKMIKDARIQQGFTRDEVATRLGMTADQLAHLERGESPRQE